MADSSNMARAKRELMALVRAIPQARVATLDDLAAHLDIQPALVTTLLGQLTDDERDIAPWHRVVAKGGAIGRGPHRDQQFARLAREGVPVSPAGIVQDLARVRIDAATLAELVKGRAAAAAAPASPPPTPASRSRGMKSRP
jgi:methylated-DNA-protein-cysteine methyltransferase related protein